MNVPQPLQITAKLTAGYKFSDGSWLEIETNGGDADWCITGASGETLACSGPGTTMGGDWDDYGEAMDSLASFLLHDADQYDANRSGEGIEAHDEYIFGERVAAWANAHYDELSILACYCEDKRLGEKKDTDPYKEIAALVKAADVLAEKLNTFPTTGLSQQVDGRITKASYLAEQVSDYLGLAYAEHVNNRK